MQVPGTPHQTERCFNGPALLAARKAKGLTQLQLAVAACTTPDRISNLEREGREPHFRTAVKIARVLGIALDQLVVKD